MAKTFGELTRAERLKLLYSFLKFISEHPELTGREGRESYAKERPDLKLSAIVYAARVMDFEGFAPLTPRGFPVKYFYEITPKGTAILERGFFRLADFELLWVRRAIVRKPIIIVVVLKVAKVSIRGLDFYLREDWNYRIFVETPTDWKASWQSDLWGRGYGVKHRTIIFVQTVGMAPNYFAGYEFVYFKDLPKEVVVKRKPVVVPRTMRLDPKNTIDVSRLETVEGRVRWEVDLSAYKDLFKGRGYEEMDVDKLVAFMLNKKYRAKKVVGVWD